MKRSRPEHDEQVRFIRFLEKEKSFERVLEFSATLNGVYLPQPYANTMVAAGLRPGPLDVIVLLPKLMLWVEMKRPRRLLSNGTLGASPSVISDAQKRWLKILNTYTDVRATIAYGAEEAIHFTSSFIPNAGIYTVSLSQETPEERAQSLESFSSFLTGQSEM